MSRRTTRTRSTSERIYYKYIDNFQLRSWTRNLQQWYVVAIVLKDERGTKIALRTRNLDDAKVFMTAFESLRTAYAE